MRQCLHVKDLGPSIRWICSDARGRAFIQWLLNEECDVEMTLHEPTFDYWESRRELGMKIRKLIADNFNRSYVIEIEDEQHGR